MVRISVQSSPASRPRPPASCISAAPAPALFNWLFARHHGGKALLRIEDTDKKRSTQEAIDAILDGLDWLGLEFDGDAVFQAERADRHAEVALKLLEAGHAYKCYATPEELEADARRAARRRSSRCAMTGAGATAIRPRRPKARRSPSGSRRPRTARR